MQRLIAAFILACMLTACATMIDGSQQEVFLTTPGAPGSRCAIRNEFFLYIINPPRHFQLERTSKDYKITCLAPGNRKIDTVLPANIERDTLFNVSNGAIPGASVDLVSGALFRYPNEIIVDFTHVKPEPTPLPDYQQLLETIPLMKGMEQWRPGIPALQSDERDTVEPLQKRTPGSDDDTFGLLSVTPGDAVNAANNRSAAGRTSGTSSSAATPTVTNGASTAYGTYKTQTSGSSPSVAAPAAAGTAVNGTSTTGTGTTATVPSGSGIMHRTLPSWNNTSTGAATSNPTSLSP